MRKGVKERGLSKRARSSVPAKIAARRAIAGAYVIPWRPAKGVYLTLEQGTQSPATLVDVAGVTGMWWYQGGVPPAVGFADNTGLQLTYCFLDEDVQHESVPQSCYEHTQRM